MSFFTEYQEQVKQRAEQNIPPLPLTKEQVIEVIELLKKGERQEELIDLLSNRVSPGVDEAAKVKAEFLNQIVQGEVNISGISKVLAVKLLGTMLGGYNITPLVTALNSSEVEVAKAASEALKHTLLVYDSFNEIATLSKSNTYAKEVLESWANAEWFLSKEPLAEKITAVVFKIDGETNTDDLSPASDAFTRSDIPLHAQAMLKSRTQNAFGRIEELKKKGYPLVYVGDVVGTGSSRKSACNSLVWHMGREIPYIPNKKAGGLVIGSVIAPIFFNTCEDSGCLPIVAPVSELNEGDVIEIYPYKGEICKNFFFWHSQKLSCLSS